MNSGIYQIKNYINGKIYIGSAKNLAKRCWEHFNDPTKTNPHLHRSIKKYGKENFEFTVIQYCIDNSKKNLELNEQYWMDLTNCYNSTMGYNISKTAGKPSIPTKESAAKGMLTKRLKGLNKTTYPKLSTSKLGILNPMFNKTGINSITSKKVNSYNEKGELLLTFNSCVEASEHYKIPRGAISRVARGERPKTHSLIFKYI